MHLAWLKISGLHLGIQFAFTVVCSYSYYSYNYNFTDVTNIPTAL